MVSNLELAAATNQFAYVNIQAYDIHKVTCKCLDGNAHLRLEFLAANV